MQKTVNDVIDIFTSEGMDNISLAGYFLVKHSHVYNKKRHRCNADIPIVKRAFRA